MIFRYRIKDPNVMMRIGLVCLIIANVSLRFLHPTAHVPQALVDGATGTAFGVSIGCLLLAARLNARRRSGSGGSPCA